MLICGYFVMSLDVLGLLVGSIVCKLLGLIAGVLRYDILLLCFCVGYRSCFAFMILVFGFDLIGLKLDFDVVFSVLICLFNYMKLVYY